MPFAIIASMAKSILSAHVWVVGEDQRAASLSP